MKNEQKELFMIEPSARMRSEGYGSRSVCLCVCVYVCLHLFSDYTRHTGSWAIPTALAQQALEN